MSGVAPTSEAAASAPPSEVEDASAPASVSEVAASEASAAATATGGTGSVLSSMKMGPRIGSELRATGRAKGSKGAGMAQKLLDLARLAHDWTWGGQDKCGTKNLDFFQHLSD